MMDQPGNGTSASQCHFEGFTTELSTHVIFHRPSNNFPRGHVFDASQVKPAFIRVDIGDVSQPNGAGRQAVELLFQ